MNKENQFICKQNQFICRYCSNEATGIIYRPKSEMNNVYSCQKHATSLYIPFNIQNNDKTGIQSSFTSPLKNNALCNSNISNVKAASKNAQIFFDRLMTSIIAQFNLLKSEVTSNTHKIKSLQKNSQAINLQLECQASNPYMIINNDQDMMMNVFVNRLMTRHNIEATRNKRQQIYRRRTQISRIISVDKNSQRLNNRLSDLKMVNSFIMARSNQCSPQGWDGKTSILTSINKSPTKQMGEILRRRI